VTRVLTRSHHESADRHPDGHTVEFLWHDRARFVRPDRRPWFFVSCRFIECLVAALPLSDVEDRIAEVLARAPRLLFTSCDRFVGRASLQYLARFLLFRVE